MWYSDRPAVRALGAALLLGAWAATGLACAPKYALRVDVPARRAPPGVRTMVVQDFAPRGWGQGFAHEVRGRLTQYGFVQPVQAGAGPLLTGQVSVSDVRRTADSIVQEVNDRNVTVYTVRSQAEATVSYSLAEGGRTLAAASFARDYDDTVYASSRAEAQADAPTDEQIIAWLLSAMVDEVTHDVSPHKQTVELALRTGDHDGLAQGVTYMQHGRFDQAFSIWDQVVEQAASASDRAAAYYNIGVIREARGEYDDAFKMFSEADALLPGDEEIIGSLSRVEKEQAQRATLLRGAAVSSGPPGYKLTVRTEPPGARVRIMNITPKYQDQIELPPGSYDVVVDAPGHAPSRQWVRIQGGDVQIDVRLQPE